MSLEGYRIVAVNPFHPASGRRAVVTVSNSTAGILTWNVTFETGMYDVAANCYDLVGAKAGYRLFINELSIGSWRGDLEGKVGKAGSSYLDNHSATRKVLEGIKVQNGDILKVAVEPGGNEPAPMDYVYFLPVVMVD